MLGALRSKDCRDVKMGRMASSFGDMFQVLNFCKGEPGTPKLASATSKHEPTDARTLIELP